MNNLLTVIRCLIPVFTVIGALCVASWAVVATMLYRERRNAHHDAEDAATFETPAVDWTFGGRLPSPDASDDEFAAWAAQAIAAANDRSYNRTLAEIRALPERKTA